MGLSMCISRGGGANLDGGLELDAISTERRGGGSVDGLGVDPPQVGVAAVGKPQSLHVLHLADVVHHTIHCLHTPTPDHQTLPSMTST